MKITTKTFLSVGILFAAGVQAFAQPRVDVTDEQAVRQMADQSFDNFKANKWNNFGTYWGWQTKDGDGYRYYWEQNLCMMATAAVAEYGTHSDAKEMSLLNTDGFTAHYGSNYGIGWNDYIDDIGWCLDSYILAYRHTRQQRFLNAAIRIFNTGFKRGNLGPTKLWANTFQDGREGLWWRVDHSRWQPSNDNATQGNEGEGIEVKNQDHYKSPLSTSPHIEGAAMLYVFTGDEQYLDKADKMWQWVLDTLWEKSQDRGIYEGWNTYRPNMLDKDGNWTGERQAGPRGQQKLHHIGTFLEATNALYQATGDEKYLAWCWKMINSVLVHRLDGNGIIKNVYDSFDGSWCWEFARGMTNFCADNQLWDYKGQIPLIEGEYTDALGNKRTYTTKANGQLKSFPNGWTMYQWMAASASQIKDNNATCIVLPTNRDADAWFDLPIKAGGSLTLEAENATLTGGAEVSKDLQASGGNTVTMGRGSWLSFTTSQNEEGYANLSVIYATGEDRKLSIEVNGELNGVYDCPKTGSGFKVRNGVDTLTVSIFLLKGDNVVRIGSDTDDCPNIDKIILKKIRNTLISTSLELEAEKTTLTGTAEVSKDLQASGGNTVVGLGRGSWLSFGYTAPVGGIYNVTVQYMSDGDLPLAAVVNDGEPVELMCKSTGGTKARYGVDNVTFSLYLPEGDNVIRLGHDTEACPVVDKISLKFSGSTNGIGSVGVSVDNRRQRLSGWYTLQGQKLAEAPVRKGIYILNGKKVSITE